MRGGDRYWDERAGRYDADTAWAVGEDILEAQAQAVRECGPFGDVLELGCGTGWFTQRYADLANTVTATDLAPQMVRVARERLAPFPSVTVAEGDAADTGRPASSFDAVVMANLIHVVPDPGAVLAETARVLRPGGQTIATSITVAGVPLGGKAVTALRSVLRFGPGIARRRRDMPLADLARLAEEAGLEVADARVLEGRRSAAVFVRACKPGGR